MRLKYHINTVSYISFIVFASSTANAQQGDESIKSTPTLNEVIVSSSALERTVDELAQPVTVIKGKELLLKSQSSLGSTLSNELGVSSSGFGPGATRPVIRGLGGDRVRILENGTGSQDVSNTSPDHLVAIDPALVDRIEILRGPSALLYGTSAVGGVVNIFDKRVPDSLPDQPLEGRTEIRGGTVDNERAGSLSAKTSVDKFAFTLSGIKRRADDIDIPGFARRADKRDSNDSASLKRGSLPFSAAESDNLTFGTSYILEKGFLGVAVSEFNSNYGVPNGEENISIDAQRRRIDIRGKASDLSDFFDSVELKSGLVKYDHTEFEGTEAGTQFKNDSADTRIEVKHKRLGNFEGLIGSQHQYSDFKAIGEEAFQPPTISNIGSLFALEEYIYSNALRFQLGGRLDLTQIGTNGFDSQPQSATDRDFSTFSQSVGAVYSPLPDYSIALALAHTERAPSGQELFANGPHIATAAFEVGDDSLEAERSLGIDLTFKKTAGSTKGSLGTFYNHFRNYIGLTPSGKISDELPEYLFTQSQADFYGIESQISHHFLEADPKQEDAFVDYQTDWVWARNRDTGDAIARLPPLRMKWGVNYNNIDLFNTRLEVLHAFKQSRNGPGETETDGYTFLNLSFTKDVLISKFPVTFFLKGNNLLNDKARESTSFIKDVAPLPGLNVSSGLQLKF